MFSTGSNPNTESPCLDIEFEKQNVPLCYPPDDQINQFMKYINNQNRDPNSPSGDGTVSYKYLLYNISCFISQRGLVISKLGSI